MGHSEVAATVDDVNHVGPWQVPAETRWSVCFGVLHPLDTDHDIDELAARSCDFFQPAEKNWPIELDRFGAHLWWEHTASPQR